MAAKDKNLFKADSSYKYEPGMEANLKYSDTIRNVSPDFLERILTAGGVTKTDLFLLRAVVFYRIATADMVVEFLQYFRHYYGARECANLLVGGIAEMNGEILPSEENTKKEIKTIRGRLLKMSQKHLLFCYQLENDRSLYDSVFCASHTTYEIVKAFFNSTPTFESKALRFSSFYCVMPVQKMLQVMHACRVGVLGFRNHTSQVGLIREADIVYGATKEHFEATMLAEVSVHNVYYKIIVEPIHFHCDERILTKSEHLKSLEVLVDAMKRIIYHYQYKKQMQSDWNEEVRFLIAAENLEGMSKAVQMMNKWKEYFSGKVFFTTERILLETGSLEKSVLAAREVADREGDGTHLGLVQMSREKVISSGNDWILENVSNLR